MRGASLEGAGRRVALLRALFLVFFVLLAARAAHLTVVSERGGIRGKGQLEGVMILPATRGLIVDRNRVELALTVQTSSVYLLPSDFDGNPENLRALAKALGTNTSALDRRLRGRKRFTFVSRWVSKQVAERVAALDLPGVGVISEPRRAYPADELASSILGFANIDGKGVRGIEEQEDEWLRGTPIRTPVERDARGRLMAGGVVAPVSSSGGDVGLTIDMAMQAAAETALRDAIKKRGARGGCVITMNPHTGEILALAESPGYNPNQFRKVNYSDTGSASFHDAVEPGSVMKAFLIAAALEAGAIRPNQRFDTGDGSMRLPGKKIFDHRPYGVINATDILMYSSNVGAVQIAERLGPQAHHDALLRFGFGKHTGSGFPSESNGLLRPWKNWKAIDHATVAYGQGMGVTAIQLAAAMSAIASDGKLRVPRLVNERRAVGGDWERVPLGPAKQAIKPETATRVLAMLESVVSAEGTGRKAALKGVRVAGKTGTAQKLDVKRGVYSKTRYGAWFMGAAPADDPKLVIVSMLDEPKGWAHGGGDVAAPLFAQVAASQLARLGIVTKPEPIRALPRPEMLASATPTTKQPVASKNLVVRKPSPKKRSRKREKTPSVVLAKATANPVGATPRARLSKKSVRSVAGLPSVSAGPKNRTPRKSTAPKHIVVENSNEAIVMPDFRGETLASVRRMARREHISLEIRGDGLAVEQVPTPGTVVSGTRKRVRVSFSGGGQGG